VSDAAAGASLRVLHLRNSDRLGGPERLLLDQARAAAPELAPVLASFGAEGAPHAFLDAARAEGIAARLVPQRGSYDPRVVGRLRQIIRDLDPGVLVGHDYKANLVARLADRDRPRVAVVHGYTGEDPKVGLFEAVDRRLLRGACAVVVVAEPQRTRLVEVGVDPSRVRVVPNGIAADRVAAAAREGRARLRAAWGVGDDERVVLVLGRLSPEKGQDLALEAFARLGRRDARLVLVGDGAARPALETRAARPDLAGRVLFLGWRDDPHACLGAADVFLLPSRTEGLPLALLEAMAAGVPAVAARVGAVAEVLAEGEAGRVVAAGDPAAMAAAIAGVLEDPAAHDALARRAARRVRDAYGVERQARALEAVYREAAGSS